MRQTGIVSELYSGEKKQAVSALYGIKDAENERQITLKNKALDAWQKAQTTEGLCFKFKANIIVQGLDFTYLTTGKILRVGEMKLEISSVKKCCYGNACPTFHLAQACPIPANCRFAKALTTGSVYLGDKIQQDG